MSNSQQVKKLNPEEVGLAMYKILKDSNTGWHNVLKGFLLSSDFLNIIKTLEELVKDDKRFTPPLKDVFKAFTACSYENLKVIIAGQDPYPQLGVADGIAFSCSKTDKKEASLRYIHGAIAKTVYNNEVDPASLSNDLSGWSKQGMLMLNTSLTTEVGKIGKHYDIWSPFINYLIDMLKSSTSSYIWVLLGKKSQELEELIGDNHTILKASHPASAAYAKAKEWDCNNVFNNINLHLEQDKLPKIIW
jgi:uracil-DNA glycosylase